MFKDESANTLTQLKSTVKAQTIACGSLLGFCVPAYALLFGQNVTTDISFLSMNVSAWSFATVLSFFVGIVVLGTCFAYVLENAGAYSMTVRKNLAIGKSLGENGRLLLLAWIRLLLQASWSPF